MGQETYRLPRAELLAHVGNETAALADYNNLLAIHPDNYWAQEQRGTLYAQMGQIEAARADFEALLTQASRDPVNNPPAYIARIEEKLASLD